MAVKNGCFRAALAAFLPLAAFAGESVSETADFSGGSVPAGWTARNGKLLSPEYRTDVLGISLVPSGDGTLSIGAGGSAAASGESFVGSVSSLASSASFAFPAGSGIRAFEIDCSGGASPLSVAVEREADPGILLSQLDKLVYAQDFETLPSKSTDEWINGASLPGWSFYKNAEAAGSMKNSSGASTTGDFYSLASSAYAGGRACGALAAQGKPMVWGVAFFNDTDRDVELESVSFKAAQWGFNNKTAQTLDLSVLVSASPAALTAADGWISDSSWRFETPFTSDGGKDKPSAPQPEGTGATIEAAIEGATVPSGGVALVRWTMEPPASGSSAILAIDDVTVRFTKKRDALTVRLVAK